MKSTARNVAPQEASSLAFAEPVDDGVSLLGLFELASEAMCILGSKHEIIRSNDALADLMGCSQNFLQGSLLESCVVPSDQESLKLSLLNLPLKSSQGRCLVRILDGRNRRRCISFSLTHDQRNDSIYVIGRDCSEDIAKRRELDRRCSHDELTSLHNRRGFLSLAKERLRSATSHQNFAVFFLDLDHFKPVNDLFGHRAGDKVLVDSALRLRDCLTRNDLLARYGGDEFVICAPLKAGSEAAKIRARIQERFEELFCVEGQMRHVGVSIGVALFPEHARCLDSLVELADADMYATKRLQGKW